MQLSIQRLSTTARHWATATCLLSAGRLAVVAACTLAAVAVEGGEDAHRAQGAARTAFRFVHMTDTHCAQVRRNPPGRFLFDPHRKDLVRSFEIVEAAVRLINEDVRPDFVVITGDLVDRGRDVASLRRVKAILSKLKCPWYPVIGDHDLRASWVSVFGKERLDYTFRHRGWRFIAADCSLGRLEPASLDRLRRELEADKGTPTILLIHRPIVLPSVHLVAAKWAYGVKLLTENAGEVLHLIGAHPNVHAVVAGHCHVAIHCRDGQVDHYVGPALAEGGHQIAVMSVAGTTIRREFRSVKLGAAPAATQ